MSIKRRKQYPLSQELPQEKLFQVIKDARQELDPESYAAFVGLLSKCHLGKYG